MDGHRPRTCPPVSHGTGAEGRRTEPAPDGPTAPPDLEGLEVPRRLRARRPDLPVLFLTARESVEDRGAGLCASADDYVPQPFDPDRTVAHPTAAAVPRVRR
ncbi:response regulator [Streptomyces sp. Ag109_O5-10]|uniref:response regulator n=1 Tax=Streptomyces sp. Ag109_O5-10 TaxID=1855349 RepID=UPI000B849FA5